ncbi:AhpC/TSA family protein [Alkaliphilus peptidifermentans DSM 18978]|uniref:AhpC/TSA family protein n=2 Tax=Alkaliphilus TaxID=114627 RepID=A0A1G5CNK9_9FIRM|nr:AhpC/TSA family protein [Alkaliphilus peptidifermentans DSM 18978]
MDKPVIGEIAPDFQAKSTNEEMISLKDFKGKSNVILFFYPKDNTPG